MNFSIDAKAQLESDFLDEQSQSKVSDLFYERFQELFVSLMYEMNSFQKENRDLFRLKPRFNGNDKFSQEIEEAQEELSFEVKKRKRFELERDFKDRLSEHESAIKLKNLIANISFKIVCEESMRHDFQRKLHALLEKVDQPGTATSSQKEEYCPEIKSDVKDTNFGNYSMNLENILMEISCDTKCLASNFLQIKDSVSGRCKSSDNV